MVAAVDRGNYPLVNFEGPSQQVRDWFPPLVAVNDGQRVYGWDTWDAQKESGWTVVRSLKRWLRDAGPETTVNVGGQTTRLHELLAELTTALRIQLQNHSSLQVKPGEPLQVVLGVPANANSNQTSTCEERPRTSEAAPSIWAMPASSSGSVKAALTQNLLVIEINSTFGGSAVPDTTSRSSAMPQIGQ